MVRVGDADLWIRAAAQLAPQHERGDTREIGLMCEQLQVEHQSRVVGVSGGHSHRAVEVAQGMVHRVPLRFPDAPLHVAHGFEVLADARAVAGAEAALKPQDVVRERVQQAGLLLQ